MRIFRISFPFTLAPFLIVNTLFGSYLNFWEQGDPIGYDDIITDGVFAEPYFYILGQDGIILRSQDAQKWSTVKRPVLSRNLRSIAYGNDTFLAVGDQGTILISKSGQDWAETVVELENLEKNLTINFTSIVHGKEGFVAVGFSSRIGSVKAIDSYALTSTDGTQWRVVLEIEDECLTSIVFGNDRYVAAGYHAVHGSSDLENWQSTAFENSSTAKFLEFGDGIFYLRGDKNQYGSVLTRIGSELPDYSSPDGITWDQKPNRRGRVLASNGNWWYIESTYADVSVVKKAKNEVRVSKLPLNWNTNWKSNPELVYTEPEVSETIGKLYLSEDLSPFASKLLYGNGIYLLTGGRLLFSFSEDMSTVSDSRVDDPSINFIDLSFSDKQIGYAARESWGYSYDSRHWVKNEWNSDTFGDRTDIVVSCANNTLFFRASTSMYVSSLESDGELKGSSVPWPFRGGMGPITYFKDRFYYFHGRYPAYTESGAGIEWFLKPRDLPGEGSLQSFAQGNGKFVYRDSHGKMYTTEDFVNWVTPSGPLATEAVRSMAYYENCFYALVGNSNETNSIWKSLDGIVFEKIDFENTQNPAIATQITRLISTGGFLCGIDDRNNIYTGRLYPVFISQNGKDFRTIWQDSPSLIYWSLRDGLNYFKGRFWLYCRGAALVSPPVAIVADEQLSSGYLKSQWFGLYEQIGDSLVEHISLGTMETGLDLDTGEFFLLSDKHGRFHINVPFNENQLYLKSVDFDTIYYVAKYNNELTLSAENRFYDHSTNHWTDTIGPEAADYVSAIEYLNKSYENLAHRVDLTVQFSESNDYSASRQYLFESKVYFEAVQRNLHRSEENISLSNPANKSELSNHIEQTKTNASILIEKAQNAFSRFNG